MDQHPIPQDVTGFQFKLIGSMTVKQFGYVAFGVISAVILYYLPINSAFGILMKLFLIPLFGASGFIIAFVPIEGRPVDIMTTNFMKAIFSPTQYIYRKQGRKLSFMLLSLTSLQPATTADPKHVKKLTAPQEASHKEQQLQAYLLNESGKAKNQQDEKEQAFLRSFASMSTPIPTPTPTPLLTPHNIAPSPLPPRKDSEVKKATPTATATPVAPTTVHPDPVPQSHPIQPSPAPTPAPAPVPHPQVQQLEKQMQEAHAQKQQLEQELAQLKQQLSSHQAAPTAPLAQPQSQTQPVAQVAPPPTPAPAPVIKQEQQHVRAIPQAMTNKIGLPHTSDTPNVVVGIVKDPRGNILPNMLVEVKDKDANPVRAFKTNALGQFASATPLPNGMYTIELEDPKKKQQFDVIQVNANGQIMMPIEIISHDAREELRKELFS